MGIISTNIIFRLHDNCALLAILFWWLTPKFHVNLVFKICKPNHSSINLHISAMMVPSRDEANLRLLELADGRN